MTEPLYLWMAFDAVLTDPERLFGLLNEIDAAGLNLTRIDDVEPVRKAYSQSTVRDLLTVPPITPELPCRSLIVRGERSLIGIRACMSVKPRGSVNITDITMKRPRRSDKDTLLAFFSNDFFSRHSVAYAFLDRWPEYVKQHVAGTINERLPGIFWLNWISRRYIEAIGEDLIRSLPWIRMASVSDGLTCWLYDSIEDVPEDLTDRVTRIETILGPEKFVKGGWQNIPQLAISTGE